MKTKIIEAKIADLKPYPNNPRVNDDAVPAIAKSITEFGFIGAIIINRENVIINGHTRVKAMQSLGKDTIPAIVVEHLTKEQEDALRIADNKTGEIAEWNMDLLKGELQALKDAGFDLGVLAFDHDEIDDILNGDGNVERTGQTDPNDVPETPEVPVSSAGELYQLGDHLLLCGDATKPTDITKLIGLGEADLWLTDPPYNVAYEGSNGLTIQNDSMEDTKFREFLRSAFGLAEKAMKPGAAFYIFHADSEGYNFRGGCHDVGLRVRECLIWVKPSLVLGRSDWQWRHEPCLYGWKDGAAHNWYGERDKTTVLEYDKPKKNDVHPTMKPVEMLCLLLKCSTKKNDIVLDTFGGSGSTLIACEQLNRKCRTMELDPKYCDVIRKRWAEHKYGEGCDWQAKTPVVNQNEQNA